MATRKTEQQISIKKKQNLTRDISPNEEMSNELCFQIEICEQLGRPISETQIREWVGMTIYGMLSKVHSHKFA